MADTSPHAPPSGAPDPDLPAPTPPLAKRKRTPMTDSGVKNVTLRVLLGLCGVTLFIGFFLPWIQLGQLVTVSGFTLTISGGEVIDMVSGPHRVVPLAVPALGVLLVAGALWGHRLVLVIAVMTGVFVLGYGFMTLLKFFLDTTGMGVWLIVAAALVSLGSGLLGLGASRRR